MTKEEKAEYNRKYRAEHKEELAAYEKQRRIANKEEIIAYRKKYALENKDKLAEDKKQYYADNKEVISKKRKKYREDNIEKFRENGRAYYERKKAWFEEHPEEKAAHRAKLNKRERERMAEDKEHKLLKALRHRINSALKGSCKSARTIELLGCTIGELKVYIESKFTEGMTWDNHTVRGWHIDHITPISHFDLTCPKQQAECFHYTNLQPLWWFDNLSKGASILC